MAARILEAMVAVAAITTGVNYFADQKKAIPEFNHPRVMKNFLDGSDVSYFKKKFQELAMAEWDRRDSIAAAAGRGKVFRPLEYFTLLSDYYDNGQTDKQFAKIVNKIYAKVEKEFGDEYVMFNDFWSWRTPDNRPGPNIHVDADFWMAGGDDGFNLWMLLDHKDMPYTFDIWTQEDNPEMYKYVGFPEEAVWLIKDNTGDEQKAKECPGVIFSDPLTAWPTLMESQNNFARALGSMLSVTYGKWWATTQNLAFQAKKSLPTFAFRQLIYWTSYLTRLTALPEKAEVKHTNLPISVGDALVVRQLELHGTDAGELQPHQYRLALGFKFMRKGAVSQYSYTSPASKTRRTYPKLRLPIGMEIGDPYRYSNSTGVEFDMDTFDSPSWMQSLVGSATAEFNLGTTEVKSSV